MILQQTHLIDRRIPAVVVAPGVLLTSDGLTSFATLVTQGIEVKPETGVEFKGVTRDELLAAKKMAEDLRVLEDKAHEAFGQFIEAPQK